MDKQYLEPLQSLNYANLTKEEEEKLRDLEKTFNTQYDKEVYFMVMKK